ncbi:ethanolamine ammonia-lyase [Mucilaginibacter sp. PPCGB 2223]|uniref:ethanolamine ammonia-lyase subunit EutC n=1 Tax=Mucilaginibacter sp. PPCGB 2223 TaxID=1886027 RepID=UPI000826A1AE|nr:ethanolamine ammonia-lyase subunit EutC [Mucilaginibacter sp. PPCGB 2223]OCX54112.1 ethanolamine ammonia-lyase [Mucilaginibacter sp. PPCGB 2223]
MSDKPEKADQLQGDPWVSLKNFTAARIAIGRVGSSIPLRQMLNFKLAHAHARDAVYSKLDIDALSDALEEFNLPVYQLHSRAINREKYLTRPDYGRRLDETSVEALRDQVPVTISLVIADGLSAAAVNQYAVELLRLLIPKLVAANTGTLNISLAEQGRVAIADEIGQYFDAELSVILVGERPGLTAPDSMSAYLTYKPRVGLTDESRNCISNIRPDGLDIRPAADKLFYLISESLKRKLSGVELKDRHGLLSS